MNSHQNARLTVHGRALLATRILEHGLRPEEAAQAMGVSVRTAYRSLARYRQEGRRGLENCSSRPHRVLISSTTLSASASSRLGTSGGSTVKSAGKPGSASDYRPSAAPPRS